jgi:hypothetical protein
MKKLTISLLKQLTLLVALLITVSFLLFSNPSGSTLFLLQIGLGLFYLIFSIAEFSGSLAKMNLPFDRFFYLPYYVISNKLIKLGAYALAAGVLWVSATELVSISVLLFIIIAADLLVFVLRIQQKVYYISLFANYILISLENEQKIFASSIEIIEYRYDIFYLKLKDKKIVLLETERVAENQKEIFTEKFMQWALRNQLPFTEEAKQKLKNSFNV